LLKEEISCPLKHAEAHDVSALERRGQWQVRKEGHHLIAPQLPAQHDRSALIHGMHLEHVLRQVEANSRSWWMPFSVSGW
jgi:hypothetical protein